MLTATAVDVALVVAAVAPMVLMLTLAVAVLDPTVAAKRVVAVLADALLEVEVLQDASILLIKTTKGIQHGDFE